MNSNSISRTPARATAVSVVFAAIAILGHGCATQATPRPHRQVGRVDATRFEPLMADVETLRATWSGDPSSPLIRATVEQLRAKVDAARGTEQSEAERLFVQAVDYGATAFFLGNLIREASTDPAKRPSAAEAERRYAVETADWNDPQKSALVFEHGAGYFSAARSFYAGRIGEGLGIEQTLSKKLDARRTAATHAPSA